MNVTCTINKQNLDSPHVKLIFKILSLMKLFKKNNNDENLKNLKCKFLTLLWFLSCFITQII